MMGLLDLMTTFGIQRTIIDAAMFFGIIFIVTLSLNFQYGNAGVPNIACALSAAIGGYTVSAIVTRLIYCARYFRGNKQDCARLYTAIFYIIS